MKKKYLFYKDVMTIPRRGELLLYRVDEDILEIHPYDTPRGFVQRKESLVREHQIVEANFKWIHGLQNIVDSPHLFTALRLKIFDTMAVKTRRNQSRHNNILRRGQINPQTHNRSLGYQVSLNLEDGREEWIGFRFNRLANFNQPPRLHRMYHNSDGLLGLFVIQYEIKNGKDLQLEERLIPINFRKVLADEKYKLEIERDLKLSAAQQEIVFLKEYHFNKRGELQFIWAYRADGTRRNLTLPPLRPSHLLR